MSTSGDEGPGTLDPRIVRWLAREMLEDAVARLVDAGGDVDRPIQIADVFVDLPIARARSPLSRALATLCGASDEPHERRWLLFGGAGSGKTTLSAMLAEVHRRAWVQAHRAVLAEDDARRCDAVSDALDAMLGRVSVRLTNAALPVRIDLPTLANWLSREGLDDAVPRYLGERVGARAPGDAMTAGEVDAQMLSRGDLYWILDGLDEVPATANREALVIVLRDALGRYGGRVLVTTRPQGYAGEFDHLDAVTLEPLDPWAATVYAERLIAAWPLSERDRLRAIDGIQRARDDGGLAELLTTPLHVTMAALLAANGTELSRSRWRLLDDFVSLVFKRELGKRVTTSIGPDDEGNLRLIHARAGLVLHMRAARVDGVRAVLRPRELRRMVTEKLRADGHDEEAAALDAERLLRFSDDRLVLLLRQSATGYGFAIRTLQEHFAAEALREDPEGAPERLAAVATDPHWLNVILLAVSHYAQARKPNEQAAATRCTVGLCESIERGDVGKTAAASGLGARLAFAMIQEVGATAWPALLNALWEIVFRGVEGPTLYTHLADFRSTERWRHPASGKIVWTDDASFQLRVGRFLADPSQSDAHRRRATSLAATLLADGSAHRQSGIELLAGLLDHDDAGALALFQRLLPWPTADGEHFLSRLLDGHREQVSAAARLLTEAHLELSAPGRLWWVASRLPHPPVVSCDVINFAARVDRISPPNISLRLRGTQIELRLGAIDERVSAGWRDLVPLAAARNEPVWRAWAAVAAFQAEPSKETLASAMSAIATGDLREFERLARRLYWPLAECLRACDDASELKRLASGAARGDLGDRAQWVAKQETWAKQREADPIELCDAMLRGSLLTDASPPDGGALPMKPSFSIYRSAGGACSAEESSLAQRVLTMLATPAERRLGINLLNELGHHLINDRDLIRGIPLDLVEPEREIAIHETASVLRCLEVVQPDVSGGDRDRWVDALHTWGMRREIYRQRSDIYLGTRQRLRALFDELLPRVAERVGLATPVVALLHHLPTASLDALRLPGSTEGLPAHIRAALAALAVLTCPVDNIARDSLGLLRGPPAERDLDLFPTVASALSARDPADAVPRLLALYDAAPDDAARVELGAALHAQLRRTAQPAFADAATWTCFALPGEFPGLQPPDPVPLRLSAISEISNLRLFKETPHFHHPLPEGVPGAGQWIVLLGENGVGKTTLLRALALSLAPAAVGTKLLDDRLPMVRNGGAARIRVSLGGESFQALVERSESDGTERVVSNERPDRPWVVGYGVRRGNARGESDREPETGPFGALHTLFERPGSLYNAEKWLLDLRRRLLEESEVARNTRRDRVEGPERRIWDAVESALRRVLPGVTSLEPTSERIFIHHESFGRVRFDALSDGYLTTAGWIVDLIARWVERQRALGEPVIELLREMVGVVLLDEIDLHLHPVWQMRVLEDVRALFPRLSFVATTHNPLALQGARRGEIFVMRRSTEGAGIEVVKQDIVPGYDVDRVLLEQFGVLHTFDHETRRLLDEYRALRKEGTPPEDPRRRRLEAELERRLGAVGREFAAGVGGPGDPPKPFSDEEAEDYRRDLRARRGRS